MKNSIGANMRSLKKAFIPFFNREADAEEFAFHLAEIYSELEEVDGLLSQCIDAGDMNTKKFQRIKYILGTHWLYHLKLSAKVTRKAKEESL